MHDSIHNGSGISHLVASRFLWLDIPTPYDTTTDPRSTRKIIQIKLADQGSVLVMLVSVLQVAQPEVVPKKHYSKSCLVFHVKG